ncbi:unnamed protein product [Protopolystoma xenopodis]|uniref:Uncharacterized protein n=1 Tax=Protopolystoma xenopodis TaxID=117903 RepID=A0A3S5B9W9_9PLAT|nr:unnamed protein product [Protopolystoma xenopodis]
MNRVASSLPSQPLHLLRAITFSLSLLLPSDRCCPLFTTRQYPSSTLGRDNKRTECKSNISRGLSPAFDNWTPIDAEECRYAALPSTASCELVRRAPPPSISPSSLAAMSRDFDALGNKGTITGKARLRVSDDRSRLIGSYRLLSPSPILFQTTSSSLFHLNSRRV